MITDSSHFSSFLHHVITLHLGFPAQTTTGSGSGSVQVASAYTCTTQELFEVNSKLESKRHSKNKKRAVCANGDLSLFESS
jgi:hypothetical protein